MAGLLMGSTMAASAAPLDVPDLRVDTNRDGRVDVSGDTDTPGEDTWTPKRGALFLPNVDDDAKRCPTKDSHGKPLPDAKLAACNDGQDSVLNGARDADDLARLRTVPRSATPDGAVGTAKVVGAAAAARTRLWIKRGGTWSPLKSTDPISAAELRSGVELGLEGKDVVRDAKVWDGTAVVRLTVAADGASASDDVTLRVAPVLTHHHLQRVQQVLVTEEQDDSQHSQEQRRFVAELARQVKAAGIDRPLKKFTEYGDIWAQDFVEPGYASVPGPNGRLHTMRVLIRSAQPDRAAGRELFEKLRGPDVGVVQVSGVRPDEEQTLNSMGNLETIPAYTHGGRSYPAGRIIMGQRPDSRSKPAKAMRTFLASQGMQSPLLLDTSWLSVGHVDEFVQFLPANTPRGWRIGVADPRAGIELLRKAQREGHGKRKMFSVPGKMGVPAPKETINDVLSSRKFLSDNEFAAKRIKANLETLKRETGVTDAEIVKVPGLFTRDQEIGGGLTNSHRLRRIGPDELRGHGVLREAGTAGGGRHRAAAITRSAYIPGAVNGVVLGKDRYLAAKQWGPVINGKDIFTQAVNRAYSKAGFTVSYIDDWYTYHIGMGEVHCGTNTLRDTSQPWWPTT
nr:protein-arginine deiminase domain-containing protein [Wenjunlia tyrosinilytica]